ncbi:MAG: glycosyltransferase [Bacteroidetes bacterium]|nr:glycosyltransferase [Bacteroidota bacterium]
MPVLTLLVLLSGLVYMLMILYFYIGWRKLKDFSVENKKFTTPVSLIIPVRNEEQNIPGLIRGIRDQDYPARLLEVIFVDDHSDDRSFQLISENIAGMGNFLLTRNNGTGKKMALQTGLENATGNLIITTDADCHHPAAWISTFASYYERYHPKLMAGPVLLKSNNNFFQRIQQIEFLSLTASTAGAFGAGHPIMCNGANLAFDRKVIEDHEDIMQTRFSSGDDIFLLHRMKQLCPGELHFVRSNNAVVTTNGQPDFRSFIQQRIRWASKSRGYSDIDTIITGLVVLLINFMLLWTLAGAFFEPGMFTFFVFLYIIKTLPDILLVTALSSYFRKNLWLFPLMQLFYPIYVVFTALASLTGKHSWKGRRY